MDDFWGAEKTPSFRVEQHPLEDAGMYILYIYILASYYYKIKITLDISSIFAKERRCLGE